MVLAEIILYVFILVLFFLYKRIKKLFGGDEHIIRLKDDHRYDVIDKKIKSKPLWSIKAHYGFLIFLFIFTFIALTVMLTVLWSVLRSTFIFTDPDAIYIGSSWGITMLPMLFIVLPLSNLLLESFPFKTARYAAGNHYDMPGLPRKLDIKISLWIFIFFFVIGFPFIIMNTDYYSYVKDEAVCVNEFFSFSENIYKIPAQIKYADVTYLDGLEDYGFYYTIYFSDDKCIEILNENRFGSEKVVKIDTILVKNNVSVNRAFISTAEWNEIKDDYNDSLTTNLKELYIVGN